MLRTIAHYLQNELQPLDTHVLVKEVAHGVDEYALRLLPLQRVQQMLIDELNLAVPLLRSADCVDAHKALVGQPGPAEAPRDGFGITVAASLGHPTAATDTIPSRVRPLDAGVLAHHTPLPPGNTSRGLALSGPAMRALESIPMPWSLQPALMKYSFRQQQITRTGRGGAASSSVMDAFQNAMAHTHGLTSHEPLPLMDSQRY